jgi:hypothetical protein
MWLASRVQEGHVDTTALWPVALTLPQLAPPAVQVWPVEFVHWAMFRVWDS